MDCLKKIILAALLCVFCSCGQEIAEPQTGTRSLTVGFCSGGDAATRTVIAPDGLAASWEKGDRIALWARNPAGEYTLDNTAFSVYGADGSRAFFTATVDAPMPEDRYTYYAVYPVPESVSGTTATFTIPSVQDGKVSSGADILVANPVAHGPIGEVKELSDYTNLGMTMEHVLHHLRFYVPENGGLEDGDAVTGIDIEMPRDVVGRLSLDFTSPESGAVLSDGGSSVSLELAEPVGASSDVREYACVSIFPDGIPYGDSDNIVLTVYGRTKKYAAAPVSLSGRAFAAGHSTPVRLSLSSPQLYFRIKFSTGIDYIGEPLRSVTISDAAGKVLYSHENTAGKYDNLEFEEEYLGEDGAAAYEAVCSAIAGGTAKLVFETENAIVEKTLAAADMKRSGNTAEVSLGDVPYLLYEDFSRAKDSSKNDSYTAGANQDMNVDGVLLDSVMPEAGWNAARYGIFGGECIRINVRFQSAVGLFKGRYCGRLDTPAMSRLKPGVSVRLKLEFDSAFMIPNGYHVEDVNNKVAYLTVGTHTESQSSAIESDTQGDIKDRCSVVYESEKHANEDVSKLSPTSVTVENCGPDTRFVFFPCTTRSSSEFAANCCYYVYLDNIKVQIAK